MALKTLGHDLASTDVDKLILKAGITQAVYEEVGTWEEKAMVRSLRTQFTAVALDDSLSDVEKSVRVGVIGELILSLGGKESRRDDIYIYI